MPDHTITCPKCAAAIPLTDALTHKIKHELKQELETLNQKKEAELARKESEISAKEKALKEAQQQTDETIKAIVVKKVEAEKSAMWNKAQQFAKEQAEQKKDGEIKLIKESMAEKDAELQKMRQAELGLRKEKSKLEDEKKAMELEVARRIDSERHKIAEESAKRVTDEYRLKEAEKDKRLQDAIKANEELRRKLEQGSQQTQGEVLEIELEELLKSIFPHDVIDPVPKGITGADVLQRVYNPAGHLCGTIAWESKRTKNWSDIWVEKLKSDQRTVNAEIAVIVSETLPSGVVGFGWRDGVWVCDYRSLTGLALVLRMQVVKIAGVKQIAVNHTEKQSVLYEYVTSTEFRHRVEAILESFLGMKDTVEKERRAAQLRWAKQEKLIQQMVDNTAGMYGDFSALLGPAIQAIPALEEGDQKEAEED